MASSKKFVEIVCTTCGIKVLKRSDWVDKVLREDRKLACSKTCAAPNRKKSIYVPLALSEYSSKHKTSICKMCSMELPIEQFFKNADMKRMKFRKSWYCQPCRVVRTKEYRLKTHYRMESIDDYHVMVREQDNLCGICKSVMSRPCIDHNHTTGEVRKLLCVPCNSLIGNAYEDIEILRSAIKYLQEYES